jgi:hypothetical protein
MLAECLSLPRAQGVTDDGPYAHHVLEDGAEEVESTDDLFHASEGDSEFALH